MLLTVMIMRFNTAIAWGPSETLQGPPWDRYARLWVGMPSRLSVVAQIQLFGVVVASEEEIMWFNVAVDKAAGVNVPHYIQLQRRTREIRTIVPPFEENEESIEAYHLAGQDC